MKEPYSILSTILEAGDAVYSIYHSDFSVSYKKKDDPLTQADLTANSIIIEYISKNFPEDGIISEEISEIYGKNNRKWLIDPIDGTREFVNKNPQFAISLGLLEDNEPTLGIIFNPANGELFYGIIGMGVHYQILEYPYKNSSIELNFTKTNYIQKEKYSCCVSISETKSGIFDEPNIITDMYSLFSVGSIAYKLGLVSVSKYDLVFSAYDKNHWDICAGIAILLASGGSCLELIGLSSIDSLKDNDHIHGLIAGNSIAIENILKSDTNLYTKLYKVRN